MIKTFCIFSQIIIQDEQTPFTIEDGWKWLADFANVIPRLKLILIINILFPES